MASGLIAGEALVGILFATLAFAEIEFFKAFDKPSCWLGLVGLLAIGAFLVIRALGAAVKPIIPKGNLISPTNVYI